MTLINPAFSEFIKQIEAKGQVNKAIQSAEQIYSLKTYKISQITSAEALKIYDSIYLKFYKGHSQIISTNWYQNQLRIFVWTLVCYIYLHQRRIQDLGDSDWKYFSTIFDRKDPKLFQYQCQALCAFAKGKNWLKEQEDLLKEIMKNKINTAKWNQVSKQLFQLSDKKYFRTAKQCRQRWNNHLDPSKIKGFWRAEQCLLMFEYVKQHGKKWASLVKILNYSRNQHSIKNKFNSIIKKHRKTSNTKSDQLIYDQIINRIKKTMENKAIFQNADLSFDLQQFNQEFENSNLKKASIPAEPACHTVTKNFFKLLQNFNPNNNEPEVHSNVKQEQSLIQNQVKNNQIPIIQKQNNQPILPPQYKSTQTQTNIQVQIPAEKTNDANIVPNINIDPNNILGVKAKIVKCSVINTPVLFYRFETGPTNNFIIPNNYQNFNNKSSQLFIGTNNQNNAQVSSSSHPSNLNFSSLLNGNLEQTKLNNQTKLYQSFNPQLLKNFGTTCLPLTLPLQSFTYKINNNDPQLVNFNSEMIRNSQNMSQEADEQNNNIYNSNKLQKTTTYQEKHSSKQIQQKRENKCQSNIQ